MQSQQQSDQTSLNLNYTKYAFNSLLKKKLSQKFALHKIALKNDLEFFVVVIFTEENYYEI